MLFRISNLREKLNYSIMKRIKPLLLAIGLFCFGRMHGQVVHLRLDTNALSSLGTIYHDSTYTIQLVIHNDGPSSFHGILSMGSSIDSLLSDSIDSVPGTAIYYPNSGIQDSIPADSSVVRDLVITGKNPPFIQGPNGLVVWPVVLQSSNVVIISDSVSVTVIYAFPAAINEPNDKNLKVYMSDQQLLIQGDGEHLMKDVKLYDIMGSVIAERAITTSGVLSMNSYSEGIYFAAITFADNTRQVFRVFNRR
jgi:hypothetical protein